MYNGPALGSSQIKAQRNSLFPYSKWNGNTGEIKNSVAVGRTHQKTHTHSNAHITSITSHGNRQGDRPSIFIHVFLTIFYFHIIAFVGQTDCVVVEWKMATIMKHILILCHMLTAHWTYVSNLPMLDRCMHATPHTKHAYDPCNYGQAKQASTSSVTIILDPRAQNALFFAGSSLYSWPYANA